MMVTTADHHAVRNCEWSTPTRDHHSAPSGHDLRPSRTIRCMMVTDHDHHGVSDRDGRGP
eukprot:1964240-Prymnesium_polylepis.1